MKYELRRANPGDAEKIIEAHRKSIREVCSKDYNSAQIQAWSGRNFQADIWRQTMEKDLVWVVSDSQQNVYGFGHLQIRTKDPAKAQAEIAGLYFVPEVLGQGFGKNLVLMMLAECRERNIQKVTLSATKTARNFYQNAGFEQIGDQTTIQIGGEQVECFNMELRRNP